MAKVYFSLSQLILEDTEDVRRFRAPIKSDFNNIPTSIKFDDSSIGYNVTVDNNDDYIWVYFNYGNTTPWSTNVLNIQTRELSENKRDENEAELINQLFILYDYHTNMLYLSSVQKKRTIEHFLNQFTGLHFIINSFYKDPEEIIGVFKKVDKIKFTHINNLFNQDSGQYKALVDLTGTDSPNSFQIEASYKGQEIKNFIIQLIKGRKEHKLDSLLICGTDEHDIETVYNVESIIKKWEFNVLKDEHTGLYNETEIKQLLLNFISHER